MAAAWPTRLSYMSGTDVNLPTEMLICWDLVSIAIQKLMTTHERSNDPPFEDVEYVRNEIAHVTYPNDIEDDMPDMLSGPIYNKQVLWTYSDGERERRKYLIAYNLYFFTNNLDYDYFRNHFKRTMNIRFVRAHEDCQYDKNMARLIYYIWELCQTFSCAMPYNGNFLSDKRFGRNHLVLADFRMTSK